MSPTPPWSGCSCCSIMPSRGWSRGFAVAAEASKEASEEDRMALPAYRVDDVRAAEVAALARVTEGALMQTAAAALAVGCARLLRRTGKVTGRRVVLLVG